jgi:hypothetical protein
MVIYQIVDTNVSMCYLGSDTLIQPFPRISVNSESLPNGYENGIRI